jgi:hypothetical protein
LLVEVRGDWKMMGDIFRFPRHNTTSGICWRCKTTPATMREFDSAASWRRDDMKLSHWDLLQRIVQLGKKPSTLMGAPGLTVSMFLFDWLHAADLGITGDFLGNAMWLLLAKQAGCRNQSQRCQALYLKMLAYYKAEGVIDKLPRLTELMIRKKSTACPKLRASASEARHLVKFIMQETANCFSDHDPIELAVKKAAVHLHSCYECLSHDKFQADVLKDNCIRFCTLYKTLEEKVPGNYWKIKPKMHLFAELCSSGANPSIWWTYRDEDFGGLIATLCRRRGGAYTATSMALATLHKFRAKNTPYLK